MMKTHECLWLQHHFILTHCKDPSYEGNRPSVSVFSRAFQGNQVLQDFQDYQYEPLNNIQNERNIKHINNMDWCFESSHNQYVSIWSAGVSGGDAAFLDITNLYYDFQLLVYPSGHKFIDPVQRKGCKESLNADRCRDEHSEAFNSWLYQYCHFIRL